MKPTFSIVALFACLATTAAAAAVDTPFDHAGIAETLKVRAAAALAKRDCDEHEMSECMGSCSDPTCPACNIGCSIGCCGSSGCC